MPDRSASLCPNDHQIAGDTDNAPGQEQPIDLRRGTAAANCQNKSQRRQNVGNARGKKNKETCRHSVQKISVNDEDAGSRKNYTCAREAQAFIFTKVTLSE